MKNNGLNYSYVLNHTTDRSRVLDIYLVDNQFGRAFPIEIMLAQYGDEWKIIDNGKRYGLCVLNGIISREIEEEYRRA